jgi:L-amino acid N-acyltransferase YncA
MVEAATDADEASIRSIWVENIRRQYTVSDDELKQHADFLCDEFRRRSSGSFLVHRDTESGFVTGWISFLPIFHSALKKGTMTECSLYITLSHAHQGIGDLLMVFGFKSQTSPVLAFVNRQNIAGTRIFERFGFKRIGELPPIPGVFPYHFAKIIYLWEPTT